MPDQIIGDYKQFIILERKDVEKLEKILKDATKTLDIYSETYKSAYYGLDIIEWIKENNVYSREFEIKK